MNNFRKKYLATAVVVAPLLMAVGCASDRKNLTQSEVNIEQEQQTLAIQEPTTTAIANMDGYMSELSDEQPELNQIEDEIEPVTETIVIDEIEQPSHGSMTDEALLLSEILGAGQDQIEILEKEGAMVVLPPPLQLVFQFGFNKNELIESERATLQEHSDYLLQHPNYVLVISGHTDNRGPETYNQRLSEQRAQNIADLLVAAGVPESQLRVSGMAGKVPRVSPDNWQENRRVELLYQDSMMANIQ